MNGLTLSPSNVATIFKPIPRRAILLEITHAEFGPDGVAPLAGMGIPLKDIAYYITTQGAFRTSGRIFSVRIFPDTPMATNSNILTDSVIYLNQV